MTKELGYKHVADFLADQTSAELSGWIEYERIDTERQISMVQVAIAKAFAQPAKKTRTSRVVDGDDDEVIDTTSPEFAENFNIIDTPIRQAPQRAQQGTEIMRG